MCILKHSNKYLLALFISHVFVIIIQAAPKGQTSKPSSIPPLTAALSHIHPHEWQQIHDHNIEQNVSTDNELEEIIKKHIKNRPKTKKPLQKAVIVGGGPDGLYAAFQLFVSGIQIVLVNDQKEEYLHNHIVELESNCMYQLRFFLGAVFNELFEKDESPGEIKWSRRRWTKKEIGKVNLKFLVNALKKRLDSLIKYVNNKEKEKEKHNEDLLRVIYRYSVDRIQFPTAETPQYSAVLKSINSPFTTSLPFDLLVCAGGTKDKIRETYLGLPKQLTKPRNYGRAVLLKGEKYKNKNVHHPLLRSRIRLDEFIKKQNIGEYVRKSPLLSQEIKEKYADIEYTGLYFTDETLNVNENKYSMTIAKITNPHLAKYLEAIENEKNKPENKEKREEYDDCVFNIVKIWFAAIAHQYINSRRNEYDWIQINTKHHEKKGMLNFDPDPINTTTSDFIQYALDNAAVQFNMLGQSALVLAVGDSALNSHFYSVNGFSLAWQSIKQATELIRDYNKYGKFNVVSELNKNFKKVKEEVLLTSKKYVEFIEEPEEIERIAWNAMGLAVKDMINQDTTQANYGFKIIGESQDDLNKFNIVFNTPGGERVYPASVTTDGKIQVGDFYRKFDTIVQAAMWLNIKNHILNSI